MDTLHELIYTQGWGYFLVNRGVAINTSNLLIIWTKALHPKLIYSTCKPLHIRSLYLEEYYYVSVVVSIFLQFTLLKEHLYYKHIRYWLLNDGKPKDSQIWVRHELPASLQGSFSPWNLVDSNGLLPESAADLKVGLGLLWPNNQPP